MGRETSGVQGVGAGEGSSGEGDGEVWGTWGGGRVSFGGDACECGCSCVGGRVCEQGAGHGQCARSGWVGSSESGWVGSRRPGMDECARTACGGVGMWGRVSSRSPRLGVGFSALFVDSCQVHMSSMNWVRLSIE